MTLKKYTLLLWLCLVPYWLFSQSTFVIGYNLGTFTKAHRNLQAYSQIYNLDAGSELKKPMKITGLYRGLTLGWKVNSDNFMFGLRWSTKKALSNEAENANGTEKLRIRFNTVNIELGLGGESVKFGASIDMGALRVQAKRHDTQTGDKTKWEGFYEGSTLLKSGAIATAYTLFLDIQPSEYFELRFYAQLPLGSIKIVDDRSRRDYMHPLTNFGFSLALTLSNE